MPRIQGLQDLEALRQRLLGSSAKQKQTLVLCCGTGCQASGCGKVLTAFRREIERRGMADQLSIRVTGCHGFFEQGPLAVLEPSGIFYCHLKPEDVPEIVAETVRSGRVVERLLYVDPASGERIQREAAIPFYRRQERILLDQNRRISPTSLDDYLAAGGYTALASVLGERSPEEVIEEIRASGLRGRGGGGFPTGRKWAACRAAPGEPKYVICNADEGDPGAYMDRSLLEGNPFAVIEGMTIGAYAIGARKGYIYVRNEYPLALAHAEKAVRCSEQAGLLGSGILGTDLDFSIRIARGAGAFVAGESTALMAAIEGRVSEPRPKDVHTVEDGLWNRPTNLNNVETWANVPHIINRGAAWFASKGSEHSKGTKIFALTGRVQNTGLVEVPMGTTLRQIVYDIGGGANNGSAVKAVQTGGPSGGCLPVERFDLPVDFETLAETGSMVGSGGMVVMDERTCMVDVARYFLEFLQDESCGKCVPCRVGIGRMLEIVTAICQGKGEPKHLDLLEELAETVAETSLCALGKTAPNPVISTLRYFRDEYEAHIREKRCPAGVCRALITYRIDPERCTGCGACLKACPHGAVSGEKKELHAIDAETCTRCGICAEVCRFEAVVLE